MLLTEPYFYDDMLSTEEKKSDTVQQREESDSGSMFFDFESPPPSADFSFGSLTMNVTTPSPPTTSSSKATPKNGAEATTTPRGGIRVSLACLPCRSRHVKCGAEMPGCSRCATDNKPCFYAKSRRGMRDRNAPKKNKTTTSPRTPPKPDYAGSASAVVNGGYTLGSDPWGNVAESTSSSVIGSSGSRSPGSDSGSRPVSTQRLLDLFYTFFYKAHPFVLPRYYLLARLDSDPSSLTNLMTVITYIATLYDPTIPTTPFRNAALAQLEHPTLPPTGFSVQTLLLTAIALHCEDQMVLGRQVLDRAIYMSVELGMNSMNFADFEPDAVLAESWRRTYWGLYATDNTFAGVRREDNFMYAYPPTGPASSALALGGVYS